MGNKNDFQEERFDSYLNKIIIFSSKEYFKKQMSISNKEKIGEMNDYEEIALDDALFDLEKVENILELNNVLKSLTAIEQTVIFLLFYEELTQNEAAKILKVYSKTVSKIKIRAINKLKKKMKGALEDEK
ncbi:MAG: sigma-70 family RNA polymerase sigma factor [Clostridia bacterium]|jgi:RNA polymerase sigma factor (sigma-70 family)|nr:sigma-70 family RNA polymerase sigma factor [Clostridia bacterium]